MVVLKEVDTREVFLLLLHVYGDEAGMANRQLKITRENNDYRQKKKENT